MIHEGCVVVVVVCRLVLLQIHGSRRRLVSFFFFWDSPERVGRAFFSVSFNQDTIMGCTRRDKKEKKKKNRARKRERHTQIKLFTNNGTWWMIRSRVMVVRSSARPSLLREEKERRKSRNSNPGREHAGGPRRKFYSLNCTETYCFIYIPWKSVRSCHRRADRQQAPPQHEKSACMCTLAS